MWQMIKNNTCVILQLITLSTMVFTTLATLYYKYQNNKNIEEELTKATHELNKDLKSIKKETKEMKDFYQAREHSYPPIIESLLFLWFDYYKRYNGLKMEDITRMAKTLTTIKKLFPDITYVSFLEKELIILYKKQKGEENYGSNHCK